MTTEDRILVPVTDTTLAMVPHRVVSLDRLAARREHRRAVAVGRANRDLAGEILWLGRQVKVYERRIGTLLADNRTLAEARRKAEREALLAWGVALLALLVLLAWAVLGV